MLKCNASVHLQMEIRNTCRRCPRSTKYAELSHLMSLRRRRNDKEIYQDLQPTCTDNSCTIVLLFGGVLIVVVFAVYLTELFAYFQQDGFVHKAGFCKETPVFSSSIPQPCIATRLERNANSSVGISPRSHRPPKISSSLTFFANRTQSQCTEYG